MHKKHLFIIGAVLVCVLAVFAAGCVSDQATGSDPTVEILITGAGTMPGLLAGDSIDGYIIWQPFVSVGVEGGIGKVVSYSQDLPPAGMWNEHTCCAVGANSDGLKNPDLAASVVALTMLGNRYMNENPDKAADLTADWLFSRQNMSYGDISVNSVDVMKASIPTILFSSTVSDNWLKSNEEFLASQRELGLVTGKLLSTTSEESAALLYDFGPYESAVKQINGNMFVTPEKTGKISIGYLPSDHDAALFVLLKDWQYFRDNYNIYLKPVTEKAGKITDAELYVNGEKIADAELVEGTGGPQLMTLLSQNTIQYAIAGTPPYISAIDKSSGSVELKILSPIQLEGSGLVVALDSPADDWNSFVAWVKERSASGRNVVLGDPQMGSIQDVQLKAALKDAGITAVMMK
jgi:NitT/TauT family transport system substrate-binding protein